ncbi:MAG: PIG-L family deacetylase, partial [Bacteroidota bacterium]
TLMTVHAHPDDETISTGGVMARYAAEGARVVCVTCTGGEHGEIVVPELDTPENHDRLGEIRAEELRRALAQLGNVESRKLGYVDSGMMGTPQNEAPESFWQADFDAAVERLLTIVRDVRPQVMVGYNDFGGYGHPDHIRSALVCKAAFERSVAEDGDLAPVKLYETAMNMRPCVGSSSVSGRQAPTWCCSLSARCRSAGPIATGERICWPPASVPSRTGLRRRRLSPGGTA